MYFEEFLKNVANVAVPLDLKFSPAVIWPLREWLPARITSLGTAVETKVRLPDKSQTSWSKGTRVVAVSSGLFANQTHITDVILPNDICELPQELFAGCKSLQRVTIPRGVSCILQGAFRGCDSLEDVYYAGTQEEWDKINIIHEARRIKEPHKLGLYCELETYIIPGNEPLYKARVHFNCTSGESSETKFEIKMGNKDVTSIFEYDD